VKEQASSREGRREGGREGERVEGVDAIKRADECGLTQEESRVTAGDKILTRKR